MTGNMAINVGEILEHYTYDPQSKTGVKDFQKFYRLLQSLQPLVDGRDRIWRFSFAAPKVSGRWLDVRFQEYNRVVYISVGWRALFEFDLDKKIFRKIFLDEPLVYKTFTLVLRLCTKEIALIKKDFMTYESKRLASLPVTHRKGIIPRKLVWKLIPDLIRPEKQLKAPELRALAEIFSKQFYLGSEADIPEMTANLYFKYCKLAYDAVLDLQDRDRNYGSLKNATGGEQYKSLADGRYGRLFEIAPDSGTEFRGWYHDPGPSGDHPWEILRGGNTTHIDLGVREVDSYVDGKIEKRWRVFLKAQSLGRMLESCRIALAIYRAGLPFEWLSQESVKLRLQGDDHIGIMPEHYPLHRGWQSFPGHLKVYDVLHLSDFEGTRAKARRLVQWLPTQDFVLAPVGTSPIDRGIAAGFAKRE